MLVDSITINFLNNKVKISIIIKNNINFDGFNPNRREKRHLRLKTRLLSSSMSIHLFRQIISVLSFVRENRRIDDDITFDVTRFAIFAQVVFLFFGNESTQRQMMKK